MLKSEAQKSGEAVLKIAAEAAAGGKKVKPAKFLSPPAVGSGASSVAGGPSRADDPIQRELDEEIEKLRGLLVSK